MKNVKFRASLKQEKTNETLVIPCAACIILGSPNIRNNFLIFISCSSFFVWSVSFLWNWFNPSLERLVISLFELYRWHHIKCVCLRNNESYCMLTCLLAQVNRQASIYDLPIFLTTNPHHQPSSCFPFTLRIIHSNQ